MAPYATCSVDSDEKFQNVTAIGSKNAHVPEETTDLLSFVF
jgi:hypothetical protein